MCIVCVYADLHIVTRYRSLSRAKRAGAVISYLEVAVTLKIERGSCFLITYNSRSLWHYR